MSVDATVALVTKAQAKEALKIPSGTTSEDSFIETLIDRASSFANVYTGRVLVETEYTEYYDGDGSESLMLRNYPVTELTSLHDSLIRTWDSGSAIDVSADVQLDAGAGMVRLWNNRAAFTRGRGNIRAIYTAGFDPSDPPHDLVEAVLLIVQHHYKRLYQDQRIGLSSETIGDHTMQYSEEAIPKKAKEILERYRIKHSWAYGHA